MMYKLVDYFDVWGNADDGWEVNNQCYVGESPLGDTFYLGMTASKKDILKFLVSIHFLTSSDMRRLYVDMAGEVIEVYERKGMRPLCAFVPA